jgi:hypothetical protein
VRVDQVAAARRVGRPAVDHVETIDRGHDLEPRVGRVADHDAVALAVLADDQGTSAGGDAGPARDSPS